MIKKLLIGALAVLLTACAEVPENVLDSTGPHTPSDNSISALSSTAEVNENGFIYDIPENSFELDLTGKKHLTAASGLKICKPEIDGIYETGFTYKQVSLNEHADDMGKYYIGDDYDSSCWVREEFGSGDDKNIELRYKSESFKGEFWFDNYSSLFYVKDFDNFVYPEGGFERIEDDNTEYELNDGTHMTYTDAVKTANKARKGFDAALGRDVLPVTEVLYSKQYKSFKVSYFPKIHGLCISDIEMSVNKNDNLYDDLNLQWSYSDCKSEVVIHNSGDSGSYFSVISSEIDVPVKAKHDKMITLQSALDLLDERTAEYLHYEVESVDLKFFVMSEKKNADVTGMKVGDTIDFQITGGTAVWEIILKETDSPKRYAYVVDVISGKRSLMRLKEDISNNTTE